MTHGEIILIIVKCIPVVLAVFIFLRLLADEYLRALEVRGLVRRAPDEKGAEGAAAKDATPPAKGK
jgi:hypothetical protein